MDFANRNLYLARSGWFALEELIPPPLDPTQLTAASAYAAAPQMGGGMGSTARRPDGADVHKLFVGNLPYNIDEFLLRSVFEPYGPVVEVVLLPAKSQRGYRCAFVSYQDEERAGAALALNQEYKFHPSDAEAIVVRWAERDPSKRRRLGP